MGLSSAMNTSINGLSLNETAIDVIGNNIANANTTGFKASDTQFQTQLLRTFSSGSPVTAGSGGTNPMQVGLGASVAAIQKNFSQGAISNSTVKTHLAIEGDGFFVLDGSDGATFSRDGSFSLNANNELVNSSGRRVQGYTIDEDLNLVTSQRANLEIPLGELTVALSTTRVEMTGAVDSSGPLATQGAFLQSEALTDVATTAAATATTLLTNVRNSTGGTVFTAGETLDFDARRGGKIIATETFTVGAASTLADFATFLDETIGIHSGGSIPADGVTTTQPGVSITSGRIEVLGNSGTVNDIALSRSNFANSNGTQFGIDFTKARSADGASAESTMVVYDSLGEDILTRVSLVKESTTTSTTTFRYYVDSVDDSGADIAIANGTIRFDSSGRPITPTSFATLLQRTTTAAATPLQFDLDFSRVNGIVAPNTDSVLQLGFQDGAAPGSLIDFALLDDGSIQGVFDNGVTKTLGQVLLATFANNNGLVEVGTNAYREGSNSGPPAIREPQTFGTGSILAGALERSNVDIGRELVRLIEASTNYRGNARVISSAQELVDSLLQIAR